MDEFRPFIECFKKSDVIRANHLLWEDFKQERTDLSGARYKFCFYLLLQENELKAKTGKDENGNYGYGLVFVPRENLKTKDQ